MEILDDFAHDPIKQNYEEADLTKRFFNYLIDNIFFYIIIILPLLLISENDHSIFSGIISYLYLDLSLTIQFSPVVYYILSEYLFQGKTIGKLITRTRAISTNNEKLTLQQVLIRSACRFIPMEWCTFFLLRPSGLHDKLSKTKVVVDIN